MVETVVQSRSEMKVWNKAWDIATRERVAATAFAGKYNPRRSPVRTPAVVRNKD
jgi:hypothetical protein